MATIEINGVTYTYTEASFGRNRGIHISAPGLPRTTFQLRPNPHDDPEYNKNQPKFYRDLAEAVANFAAANNQFPPDGHRVTIFRIDYTVDRR